MKPLVAICIPTYKRPKSLLALLNSLAKLEVDGFLTHILIADNDPGESAREVVEAFIATAEVPVTYVKESTRGLSSVRNRLVEEARHISAEFVAFIDDDETADPLWLTTLYNQMVESNAAGVGGRQVFEFTDDTPDHVRICFRNPPRVSGKPLQGISTANGLFRMKALNALPGPFDVRLNLTGGEDSMLSASLRNAGYLLVGSHEAVTYEFIPPSRCTPGWIIKRAYRVGTTRGRLARWINPTPISITRSAVVSGGLIIVSFVQLLYYLVADRSQWLNRVRKMANGFGGLASLISTKASPPEYLRTHGE